MNVLTCALFAFGFGVGICAKRYSLSISYKVIM